MKMGRDNLINELCVENKISQCETLGGEQKVITSRTIDGGNLFQIDESSSEWVTG